ncbi:hypothetical protein SAMN04487996_105108 [Dyadobacter soli]|uniref:Uncharacterized protein n=1 Tax=Dyadobacter soli TaxID=659014 RepID=A0A1G7D304_9BACT|nr:hypothetical protein [Dyadobacter soli]SDE45909.1 hypothetical protein SAMN04487996_105108 [Dyadobacter soli]
MALLSSARYRAAGVFLALAGLLGFCVASTEGLINVYRIILPGNTLPDGAYPYPPEFWGVNAILSDVSICFLVIGMAAVFLAKERDEYLERIRLESVQFAVYAQFLVGLVAFAYVYCTPGYQIENTFQGIMGMACGAFLVAYGLRYYYIVHIKTDEE